MAFMSTSIYRKGTDNLNSIIGEYVDDLPVNMHVAHITCIFRPVTLAQCVWYMFKNRKALSWKFIAVPE